MFVQKALENDYFGLGVMGISNFLISTDAGSDVADNTEMKTAYENWLLFVKRANQE